MMLVFSLLLAYVISMRLFGKNKMPSRPCLSVNSHLAPDKKNPY